MQTVDELLRRFGVNPAAAPPDELEEFLFEIAARELHEGQGRAGLMARAFSDANGDEARAKAGYLRMRVAQLRSQYEAAAAEQARRVRERSQQPWSQPVEPQPEYSSKDRRDDLVILFVTLAALGIFVYVLYLVAMWQEL